MTDRIKELEKELELIKKQNAEYKALGDQSGRLKIVLIVF